MSNKHKLNDQQRMAIKEAYRQLEAKNPDSMAKENLVEAFPDLLRQPLKVGYVFGMTNNHYTLTLRVPFSGDGRVWLHDNVAIKVAQAGDFIARVHTAKTGTGYFTPKSPIEGSADRGTDGDE